jgi:hypothetical protein
MANRKFQWKNDGRIRYAGDWQGDGKRRMEWPPHQDSESIVHIVRFHEVLANTETT